MEKEDYDLEVRLTYKQCAYIEKALDFYTRIASGQLNDLSYLLSYIYKDVDYRKFDEALKILGSALGYKAYGIRSTQLPNYMRQLYDMQQELRYRRSWSQKGKNPQKDDRTSDMIQVSYDEPLITSGEENIWCRPINKIKEKLESI